MNFYAIDIQHFTTDSNSKNNNSQGFENSQMDRYDGICMSGGKFYTNDKWQIKLLSEFLCNSHSTFYKWL